MGWRGSSTGWFTFGEGCKFNRSWRKLYSPAWVPSLTGLQSSGLLDTNPGRTQLPVLTPLQIGVKTSVFYYYLYSWSLALSPVLVIPSLYLLCAGAGG